MWVVAEALHNAEPFEAAPRSEAASVAASRRRLMVRMVVNLVGGGGFVALLVAGSQLTGLETPLRIAALLWFAALLAIKFALWSSMDRDDADLSLRRRPN
jgi:hypothetical protein